MTKLEEKDYYDGGRLLSYNAPITMACGVRSTGKTYFFKRRNIRKFITDGERWIYLRRYDEQVKAILRRKDKFFSDLMANDEFKGYELRLNGRTMEVRRTWGEDESWQSMGNLLALSSYENEKSTTDAQLCTILFEEFIKERKRVPYIENEVSSLMNLWETADRQEDRVKIQMLGNAADMNNPYFLEWDIRITPDMPRFTRWRDNTIALEYFSEVSEAFTERMESSNIYKVTKGTAYSRYAHQNVFQHSDSTFIYETKPSAAKHVCTICYYGRICGIWLDYKMGEYYVTATAPDDGTPYYALTRDDMRPNMVMLHRADAILKTLGRMYRYGYIWFETIKVRELFIDLMRRMGQF